MSDSLLDNKLNTAVYSQSGGLKQDENAIKPGLRGRLCVEVGP